MPNVQPAYNTALVAGVIGQVATFDPQGIVSRIVQTTAGLAFGLPVRRGTADNTIDVASGSGVFEGITVLDKSVRPDIVDTYHLNDVAAVMRRGVVFVNASVAVAQGDPVYFTSAGVLTNVSTSNTLIAGARWESTTTGTNKLAKLRLTG